MAHAFVSAQSVDASNDEFGSVAGPTPVEASARGSAVLQSFAGVKPRR